MEMTPKQQEEFLKKSDEYIFFHGACHVLAASLYHEFYRRGTKVSVFEMQLDGAFKHYLVGRSGICMTDVYLKWEPPNGFEFQEIQVNHTSDLAKALGMHRCCIQADFLAATKARAEAFVNKNSQILDKMAVSLNSGEKGPGCRP